MDLMVVLVVLVVLVVVVQRLELAFEPLKSNRSDAKPFWLGLFCGHG